MKNFPMRMTLLLCIGWIVAMLLSAWVNAGERLPLSDILVKVTDSPPPVTIPEWTSKYTDKEYAAWARDENKASEKASYDAVRWESKYLEGTRTTSAMSGSSYLNGSSSVGVRGRGRRGSYGGDTQMHNAYSGSAHSVTVPFRYRNPEYVRPPVVIINPFCRPKYDK